jgi:molybdate transport system substrate-binding protein
MYAMLCAAALLLTLAVQAGPAPLTVSAATSLTDVLADLATAYKAAGGADLRLNVAGSNVLARQIVNGAPVDVFLSADEAQMDVVQRAGGLVPGSRVDLVRNRLAIVAAPDRVALVRDHFAAAPPEIRRVAIGEPTAVPAGVYARQYLERHGLWKAYESRLVPTAHVRAALLAVENGGADAAIVYATDVAAARSASVAILVPRDQGPRIVYPAAVIAASRNATEAARFLAFLTGPSARAIFARHGFDPAATQ